MINYRLAAFGCVSVVSGLMLQNSMHEMWSMNKQMQIMENRVGALGFYLHGSLQLISFSLLLIIFFANMVSTYVGVAQVLVFDGLSACHFPLGLLPHGHIRYPCV